MLKAFIYDESFCKLCKKIPPDHFYRWMKPVFVGHYKNLEYKVLEYWDVCEKCVSQRPFITDKIDIMVKLNWFQFHVKNLKPINS